MASLARLYRFGPYELDKDRNELRKFGIRLKLERKPLQLLMTLVDRSGEVVPRSDLQALLWGEGVFVDFDKGLSVVVTKLRAALHDSSETPTYVETVAGQGYRFIADVERVSTDNSVSAPAQSDTEQPVAAFSRSPNGPEHQPGSAGPYPISSAARRSWWRARRTIWLASAACVVLLALAITMLGRRAVRASDQTHRGKIMLVVLPFENLSGDSTQDYLSDGITEELSEQLGNLNPERLGVIGRTSAMTYKHSSRTISQIGRDLGVGYVLEGSVRSDDKRVRVTAQLAEVSNQAHVWAAEYDRDIRDLVQLEDEVAREITRQVGASVRLDPANKLNHHQPESEAHDAYLRALYFMDRDDKEGALKCMQYLQDATAKDPNYAAAYALLTHCYDLAQYFGVISSSEAASKEKTVIMKAVGLDDGLAEAHSILADYYFEQAWDFRSAEREYKRALELDPNSSVVHEGYADYLRLTGTMDKGVQEQQRAHELDPLSLHQADKLGWTFLYARRYDEAVDHFRKVLEMDPNYRRSIWGLARTYELKGMYREAISECRKIPTLPGMDSLGKALFERHCSLYEKVYGGGHINRKWYLSARHEIKDCIERDEDAYFIAALYAETGESERALALLEQAYAQHDGALEQLKVDPRLDKLRSSLRFQALLRRMNFPE